MIEILEEVYKAEEVLNGINKKVAAIRCMARNADKQYSHDYDKEIDTPWGFGKRLSP